MTVGTNVNSNINGDIYEVEKLIAHEGFDTFLAVNDVGLIRLKKNITFSEKVQPVELPTENLTVFAKGVRLSGWGKLGVGIQ